VPETEEKNNMPMVNGKKFPYTKEGMAAAKKAAVKKGAKEKYASPKAKAKHEKKENPFMKAKERKMGKS
jgi:hypothetical protein